MSKQRENERRKEKNLLYIKIKISDTETHKKIYISYSQAYIILQYSYHQFIPLFPTFI